MKFTYHAQTDTGLIRSLNEDSVRAIQPPDADLQGTRGDLLVVADGMGGHESGEVASVQTVETISEMYYRLPGGAANALVQAIREANAVVFRRAQAENRRGMGTTVVAAAHTEDTLHIAHVGDSRLYLIREGTIQALTEDHSLVAEQVAAGILTPEEAERHPHRNVISRAVGTTPEVEVELSSLSPLELQAGDIIVLCSDGLTEHVKPPRILQLVQHRTPEEATQVLIDAANAAGGTDNISVIVAMAGEPTEPTEKTKPLLAAESEGDPRTAAHRVVPPSPAAPARPAAAAAPPQKRNRGLPSALISVVASLVVLGALVGLGYAALSWLRSDAPPPIPTPTVQNNLLVSPSPEATAPASTATPTVQPTLSATIAPEATLTSTTPPAASPTPPAATPALPTPTP